MKVKSLVMAVALLLVGGALGYLIAKPSGEAARPVEKKAPAVKKAIDDKGEEASIKALRARVRDLEEQLAKRAAEPAETNALAAAVPPPGADGRHEGFRERMERMKTEEPERYAQMTNRFAQWRQRRAEQQKARMDFLSSIDTSRMSAAARGVHESLQKFTAQREELEQQMQNEDLTDEERHALWGQMHETNRQIMSLNGVERKNLIEETARNLGFEGQDVKEISSTMQEIIEATDSGFGGGPGRHGGHRPGGGPRPR